MEEEDATKPSGCICVFIEDVLGVTAVTHFRIHYYFFPFQDDLLATEFLLRTMNLFPLCFGVPLL